MSKEHKTNRKLKVQTGIRAGIWLAIGAGLGDLQIASGSLPKLDLSPIVQAPSVSPQTSEQPAGNS